MVRLLTDKVDSLTARANQADTPPMYFGAGSPMQQQAVFHGWTTSTIAARAGNVMGTGTVAPCHADGTTITYTGDRDILACNDGGTAIPANVKVRYTAVDGNNDIITGDCAYLTNPGAPAGVPGPPYGG